MYVPTVEGSIDFDVKLGDVGEFNFPKPETYHGHVNVISLDDFETSSGYTKFEENKLHRVHSNQVKDYMSYYRNTLNAKFYVYQKSNDEYEEYKESVINEAYTYYVQVTSHKYEDAKRDEKKYKNTGKVLYKLSTEPEVAGDKQVYVEATSSDLDDYWNFDKYPLTENPPYGCPIVLYASNPYYIRATQDEIYNRHELGIKLYYKAKYSNISSEDVKKMDGVLFMSIPMDVYVPKNTFTPSLEYNYIFGESTPNDEIPTGDPLTLYDVADFIPAEEENYAYNDLKLGNVKIPNVVSVNGLDLPFKYDYTIVPCMNYGKLPHLAVSNTVDFSKLHAFNQSNFNIWKYRIDGNQLRLTFGAEVFDTYENDKVDAVILEFYDLWGFAGSLEITNKKSYTGTFTKILDLNALNSLSAKKISGVGYTYKYARNINIQEAVPGNPDGGFKFEGKEIQFIDHDSGWRYADGSELGDNNDCGALYSNIVYGVKTYFRRTVKGEHEFIRKGDLFMFTLPLYNDYYYTVDNFNTLTNPTLDMFLTYKITDNGTKIPLNYDEIIGGYCSSDREVVATYVAGNYDVSKSTSFDLIKYYKFKGTSDVSLEVGLKKEYSDFNLRYNPIINSYFTCELKLLSDDSEERTYSIKVGGEYATDFDKALNYNNSDSIELSLDKVNRMGFDSIYSTTKVISEDFNNYNFLNSEGVSTVPINYEFVVGYKINVTDIRPTQVPATTVCALFHQNDGNYNYEDFGIYKYESSGNDPLYLSKTAFYNGGDSKTVKFGIAEQVSIDDTLSLSSLFNIQSEYTSDAVAITDAGILNAKYLKDVVGNIGKLAFCNPHVHAIDDSTTSCISYRSNGSGSMLYLMGAYGSPHTKVKRFNLVASTESMFNQRSKFVSTVLGDIYSVPISGKIYELAEFSSVDASQLEVFNKKLLKTMSNVYAYNPDYDFINTFVGDVKVKNNNLQFISNLISTNANFNFPEKTTLNDYIFIGPMCFNSFIDYLSYYSGNELSRILTKYADKNPLAQLGFIPNYTFCGKKEEPYLISSVTYNIPVSDEVASDLNYTSSNTIIVKHSDSSEGSNLVTGDLNKKVLYGFSKKYNKLVSLNGYDYSINSEGELTLFENEKSGTQADSISFYPDNFMGSYVEQSISFSGAGINSNVDVLAKCVETIGIKLKEGTATDNYPSVFIATRSYGYGQTYITLNLDCFIVKNEDD